MPENDEAYLILLNLSYSLAVCDKLYNAHSTVFWDICAFYCSYSGFEGYFMSAEEVAVGLELVRFWGDEEARWKDVEMMAVGVSESILMARNFLFEYETLSAGGNMWKVGF